MGVAYLIYDEIKGKTETLLPVGVLLLIGGIDNGVNEVLKPIIFTKMR